MKVTLKPKSRTDLVQTGQHGALLCQSPLALAKALLCLLALGELAEQFDEDLRRRHDMRPGMTGLWQSEARDNPSFSAYRRLDLFYVDNWSLTLDFEIALNTVYSVCVRAIRGVFGAARPPTEATGELGAAYDDGIAN